VTTPDKLRPFFCAICQKRIDGEHGNNPHPVAEDGFCCDHCNWTVVLPARVTLDKRLDEEREEFAASVIDAAPSEEE
jgi:hypothetical protein